MRAGGLGGSRLAGAAGWGCGATGAAGCRAGATGASGAAGGLSARSAPEKYFSIKKIFYNKLPWTGAAIIIG